MVGVAAIVGIALGSSATTAVGTVGLYRFLTRRILSACAQEDAETISRRRNSARMIDNDLHVILRDVQQCIYPESWHYVVDDQPTGHTQISVLTARALFRGKRYEVALYDLLATAHEIIATSHDRHVVTELQTVLRNRPVIETKNGSYCPAPIIDSTVVMNYEALSAVVVDGLPRVSYLRDTQVTPENNRLFEQAATRLLAQHHLVTADVSRTVRLAAKWFFKADSYYTRLHEISYHGRHQDAYEAQNVPYYPTVMSALLSTRMRRYDVPARQPLN